MADGTQAVVLAAGQGTRMRSDLPKVLHPLGGRPLIDHVVDAATEATGSIPLVVISPEHTAVARALEGRAEIALQEHPRGSGDALRSVPAALRGTGPVLVLSGDVPLVRPETMQALLAEHAREGVACTLLAVVPDDPHGLGRIVRDARGRVVRVVEERDLSNSDGDYRECNAGVYVFDGARLWPALEQLRPDNAQGELYLTDVVALLAPAAALVTTDPSEALGINDRAQLARAEAVVRARTLDALMRGGVTVEDPATTYVDSGVVVGRDTVLRPMTVIRGATTLGIDCDVGPMAQLRDVRVGDRVHIGTSTIEESVIEDEVTIGQYARLRPGTTVRTQSYIGTHAELKNSSVGPRARLGHFCCVLDADLGADVNFSAGAITCNYDGESKSRTIIEDSVFVGSDCMLVAPVRIGAGAYLAAGSVITRDVPAGALAVERAEERVIKGWADRRRERTLRKEPA